MTRPTLTHSKHYPISGYLLYGDSINARPTIREAVRTVGRGNAQRAPLGLYSSSRGRLWDIALNNRTGGALFLATDPRTCASLEFFADREYHRWYTDHFRHDIATLTPAIEGTP